MALFTQSKGQPTPEKQKSNVKEQTFGSALVELGKGDFTKPYINTSSTSSSAFVRFGRDNKYPQLIDQMYYQSPLHSSIIDFQINATVGGGFDMKHTATLSGIETVEELTFLKRIRAPRLLRAIALDLKMHKRFHALVTKEGDKVLSIQRVLPSKVRYNKSATKFWVSDDWTSSKGIIEYSEYDLSPAADGKKVTQMYSYIDIEGCPGQDVYPLDKTTAAFNWIYLDGQSANLQKDNIQRSIFGNLVIKRPTEFKSTEEFEQFKKSIETKEGDVVPVLVLSAEGIDNLPIVEAFPANENHKLFENLDKRIDDKICQSHTINPAIMGIERPGALGSGVDIPATYTVWEQAIVRPFRLLVEEVMDDIVFMFKAKGTFKIKDYRIIDGVATEVKSEEFSGNGSTVSNAGLNDNLTGLSAVANADIYRITRDFKKERLSRPIASSRLAAYGFDAATIDEILTIEDN